ncbi:MAG: N-acetyl-gamma-glutamyl-phosphate reductase [Planctomycetota bacterium]|jgi:N-acetyl-gamma-glutamyl-phosphate reductase
MTAPLHKVGIVGASGYTGKELARLIESHPSLDLAVCMSARQDSDQIPAAPEFGRPLEALDTSRFKELEGLFTCTPHGLTTPIVAAALEADCRVVDLSADFRLRDAQLYEEVYGVEHSRPDLLAEAVYGLTERARERVKSASLVANPGCYPTSILLPLLPLLERGAIDEQASVICDSKSGVSGAGKTPSDITLFGNVHDNFRAYGVGTHRHQPEIAQETGTSSIIFVPHLLPTFRGILSTIYVKPTPGEDEQSMRSMLDEAYAAEPFVRIHHQALPELRGVQDTNYCDIGLAQVGDRVAIISCIDNLLKGAAGQALQNMNLMLGLDETSGLGCAAACAEAMV